MGTSKSYIASIKGQPQWGNLSATVTTNCDGGIIATSNLSSILSKYVGIIGGSGRAGRGNSKIAGRSGIRTARKIGTFLGAFATSGGDIQYALEQVGLDRLDGLPLNDVINRLLEHCTGPSSTLDDVAAKAASQKILEELAGDAATIEEWQQHLNEVLNNETLEDIIGRYFGFYIFEHL